MDTRAASKEAAAIAQGSRAKEPERYDDQEHRGGFNGSVFIPAKFETYRRTSKGGSTIASTGTCKDEDDSGYILDWGRFNFDWNVGHLYLFIGGYWEYHGGNWDVAHMYIFIGGYCEYHGGDGWELYFDCGWELYFDWGVIYAYTYLEQRRSVAAQASQA